MTTPARPKAWLFAGYVVCSLAGAKLAHASPHLPSAPKTATGTVKLGVAKIVQVPEPQLDMRLAAPPLVLQPPRERLILGLRLPTFIAFGLGGLSAGGALATRFAAKRGNDPATCDSRCTDEGVRRRALMVTTGVLTGLAAAGVGVGITLMLNAPKHPTRDTIRPRFDLGLSGGKAVAKVGWNFRSF